MPEIPLRRVLSVSSEDPRFPASNLLQPDEGGRWLSVKGGEKQISVVLELAEPKPIHSLHIGNCGSAFVEVLVGSAGGDYEVLVPTAAFLSPNESRTGAELKRVRLFGAQSLVKGVAGKSWERLRLVCSQPYCQTRPFGLSFVRVFSPPEDKEETPVRRLGPFTLREEGASPPRPPGSLFYQRPSSPTGPAQSSPGPSYAAAALQSSPKAPKRRPPTPKANGTPPSKQLAPGPAPTASSPAPKAANSASKASSSTQKSPSPTLKAPGSTHKATNSTHKIPGSTHKAPSSSPRGSNSNHKASTPTPKAPGSTHKALSSSPKGSSPASKGSGLGPILGGVVFALSGFENPLRSQLREAALELGAIYSPDWTETCTHLVSAFPRTPKVTQARAQGGVVVGPSWIWECQKRQRRLPCGPYLLGGSGSASSDTEEEESSASAPPPASSSPAPKATPPSPDPAVAESPPPGSDPPLSESGDSGNQSEGEDPYGGSTEENSEEEEEGDIPPLPNFFEDKTFFLHGDFPPGEGRLLLRYLTAFGGTLAPYMDDSVTHVVTAQDWDPAFDEALELRPSLTFVRPRWLLLCGQRQRPLPAQPFAVVPNP